MVSYFHPYHVSQIMHTKLLFRDNAYLRFAAARVIALHDNAIELDRTIFYPSGGGQGGDSGVLIRENGERITIIDTRNGGEIDFVLHIPATGMPKAKLGEIFALKIDWDRRYAMMRLHTALHVLSCVIDAPVTGCSISPGKAHLDFDISMSLLGARKIEQEINALIAQAIKTHSVWITEEHLDAQPELVKTMSVQPPRGAGRVRLLSIPGIDLQPCGGTHVQNIAEIGGVRVLKIRNEGRCNRRVEIALVD